MGKKQTEKPVAKYAPVPKSLGIDAPAPLSIRLKPRNERQQHVLDVWNKSRILILLGPAGVGKDFLAFGLALKEVLNPAKWDERRKPKITLTRPMVACDEEFGFLPGDLNEKLEPWLMPFHDVLADLTDGNWDAMRKSVNVEFVPTGMLRGRTISHGVLIVDEAQNASDKQLKCICTRIGERGKVIILADVDQSDMFADPKTVPIAVRAAKLEGIDGVSVVRFGEEHIVRDELVRRVLGAWD